MPTIDSARMQAWLDLHNPKLTRIYHGVPDGVNAMLEFQAVVAGPSSPVVSSATLTGSAAASVMASSQALKQTDSFDVFFNSPMDGCTSLMDMARVAANFKPSEPDSRTNQAAYNAYIARLLKCPLFSCNYSDTQTTKRSGKNWEELINAIADTFVGIAAEDKMQIGNSLKNLANSAATRSSTQQTEDLFVQNVLHADSTGYLVYIYDSHVSMQKDQKKGSTSFQDTFTITRTQLRFRHDEWSAWATKVWDMHKRSVVDWLDDNNTPAGKEPANLCIPPVTAGAVAG